MADPAPLVHATDDSAEARLRRRLDRERRARAEAERIAEEGTRSLYQKQQEVLLLQRVTTAANQASRLEDVLPFALDAVCGYTEWPVGHVYVRGDPATSELTPTGIWHLDDPERFQTFRAAT